MEKNGRVYILFISYFILNCGFRFSYSPDPAKDVKIWVKNLLRQRSFGYEYRLKSYGTMIDARGYCVVKRGEHVKGRWDYGDTVIYFEYIGVGDREWSKKDGKYLESARGEESNIYDQVKRVLEFDQFELLSHDKDYLFRFNATLPFLAPDRWREMVGYIEISKKFYLPSMIWVGLPDSSVYWQVKIFDYNNKKSIQPLVHDFKDYELKIDSTIGLDSVIKKIQLRLKLLNLSGKIFKADKKLFLRVPWEYEIHDIKDMLAPGKTFIFEIAKNPEEASHIGYHNRNINRPVYLKKLICGYEMIKSVDLKFDHIFCPYLLIRLKKAIEPVGEIAIEVDSVVIATQSLDTEKKMDKIAVYLDMEYPEILKYRAFMLCPLFNIEVMKSGKGLD
ncbi:MAG: hypothetical protein N3A65_09155 [candidate division WOR-3 bacterium]|nr:hypothetical protein [candidate division WOR-3 bacterium]